MDNWQASLEIPGRKCFDILNIQQFSFFFCEGQAILRTLKEGKSTAENMTGNIFNSNK